MQTAPLIVIYPISHYNRCVMNKIAQFESLAKRLVEGTFARLFAGQLPPTKVAVHLTQAMEEHQAHSSGATPQAPTHYWVHLDPNDYAALAAERPSLEGELARHIAELAAQSNLALEGGPVVRVVADEALASHDVRVDARWMPEETDESGETREIDAGDESEDKEAKAPAGRPFLILEGQRHVDLTQPMVSIGRALDNDVIVEDPRVSRHHAQLRQRYGHYVLYDLGSSGGTRINGYPIGECLLRSGDVISLAGVQVIYGEDPPATIPLPEGEDTPPLN